MLTQDPIILSSGVVATLPLYYQYAAKYLSDNGRAVIRDDLEEKTETA